MGDEKSEEHIQKIQNFMNKSSKVIVLCLKDVLPDESEYHSLEIELERAEGKVISELPKKTSEEYKEHGLSGLQLDFKLEGFDNLADKLIDNFDNGSLMLKSYILKWINNILSSLKILFPVIDIIQEIKDRIELALLFDQCEEFKEARFKDA